MKTLRQVLKGLVLAIVLSVLIISGMRLKNTLSRVSADRVDKKTDKKGTHTRDKNNNTAQILKKRHGGQIKKLAKLTKQNLGFGYMVMKTKVAMTDGCYQKKPSQKQPISYSKNIRKTEWL